jgi:FMN-dependent NADH-azoreductase
MAYLRVDSSIRGQGSVSRELTDAVVGAWRAADPGTEVVHRDLAADPGLGGTWQQAAVAGFLPEPARTAAMRAARAVAARCADELAAADAVVIGAPLYNFGVPAAVKSWIDVLITDPRFDPRTAPAGGPLRGRPVTLAVACGGAYGPDTPRAGWDHGTPHLRRIFADLFGADVALVVAELTAADVDPALAALRPAAARSRAAALAAAAAAGTATARRPVAPTTR